MQGQIQRSNILMQS